MAECPSVQPARPYPASVGGGHEDVHQQHAQEAEDPDRDIRQDSTSSQVVQRKDLTNDRKCYLKKRANNYSLIL